LKEKIVRVKVVVYLSNNVIYKRRHDLEINEIDLLWLEISIGKSKPFLLNFIYRPLTQKRLGGVYDAQLDIVDCSNLEYYILDDININYMIIKVNARERLSKGKGISR